MESFSIRTLGYLCQVSKKMKEMVDSDSGYIDEYNMAKVRKFKGLRGKVFDQWTKYPENPEAGSVYVIKGKNEEMKLWDGKEWLEMNWSFRKDERYIPYCIPNVPWNYWGGGNNIPVWFYMNDEVRKEIIMNMMEVSLGFYESTFWYADVQFVVEINAQGIHGFNVEEWLQDENFIYASAPDEEYDGSVSFYIEP